MICLTIDIVLVIFRVVSPSEAGAEPEVRELDVTIVVKEDVVRLDVAVDEAHLVNTVHSTHQLTDVEPENNKKLVNGSELG